MDADTFQAMVEKVVEVSRAILSDGYEQPHSHLMQVCVIKHRRPYDGITLTQYVNPLEPRAVLIKLDITDPNSPLSALDVGEAAPVPEHVTVETLEQMWRTDGPHREPGA